MQIPWELHDAPPPTQGTVNYSPKSSSRKHSSDLILNTSCALLSCGVTQSIFTVMVYSNRKSSRKIAENGPTLLESPYHKIFCVALHTTLLCSLTLLTSCNFIFWSQKNSITSSLNNKFKGNCACKYGLTSSITDQLPVTSAHHDSCIQMIYSSLHWFDFSLDLGITGILFAEYRSMYLCFILINLH